MVFAILVFMAMLLSKQKSVNLTHIAVKNQLKYSFVKVIIQKLHLTLWCRISLRKCVITYDLSEWMKMCMYIYCCWIGCGLNSRLNTFVSVLSHDLDFHRYMSYFMLSPPQPCTNIKTKSAPWICFMLKIFRIILGKTIEMWSLHSR